MASAKRNRRSTSVGLWRQNAMKRASVPGRWIRADESSSPPYARFSLSLPFHLVIFPFPPSLWKRTSERQQPSVLPPLQPFLHVTTFSQELLAYAATVSLPSRFPVSALSLFVPLWCLWISIHARLILKSREPTSCRSALLPSLAHPPSLALLFLFAVSRTQHQLGPCLSAM